MRMFEGFFKFRGWSNFWVLMLFLFAALRGQAGELGHYECLPTDGAKYVHPYSHNSYGDPNADNSSSDWSGVELSWGAADDVSYDVYFGKDFSDVNSASNVDVLPGRSNRKEASYHCGALADNTTYYWRVDEVGKNGTVRGAVRSFSTNVPAFPGAEGFGRYAVGGRGGRVIKVTNLNDSGAGSLRAAVEAKGARTVVFEVSGTIELSKALVVRNPYLTIAGQTAPGDGICLKGPMSIAAHDVVVRYIRARQNNAVYPNGDSINDSWNPKSVHDFILDHCSASWGTDETLTIGYSPNVTVQWCIISEALLDHSMGLVCGGPYGSYHHNLLAHCNSRNPRYTGLPVKQIDFRNNVIYNWGGMSSYGGEGCTINHVNNYYKYGPATRASVKHLIFSASPTVSQRSKEPTKMYCDGNFVTGSAAISKDNWAGGIQYTGDSNESTLRLYSPLDVTGGAVTTQSAEDAYGLVLSEVGASVPRRDIIDSRIVREVREGTSTYGVKGILSSPMDVGGWPVLNSTKAVLDSDGDGMADAWEKQRGLNPNDAGDGNADGDGDGYTNVEDYLNDLIRKK